MKLPVYQSSASPSVRGRQAQYQKGFQPMGVRDERFIPEITAAQQTRFANVQSAATEKVTRSAVNALTVMDNVANKINEMEATQASYAAQQAYGVLMTKYVSDKMMFTETVEREESDSSLGFTENRWWETLDTDYIIASDRFVTEELTPHYLNSKLAKTKFDQFRATFDKQKMKEIGQYQRNHQISRGMFLYAEAMNSVADPGMAKQMRDEAGASGLDPDKVGEIYNNTIVRINEKSIFMDIQAMAIEIADAKIPWTEDMLLERRRGIMEVLKSDDFVISVEGMRKIDSELDEIDKEFHTVIARQQTDHYNRLLELLATSNDDEALLQKAVTKRGARLMFGEHMDDLIKLYDDVHDEIVEADFERLIDDKGGMHPKSDAEIRMMIYRAFKQDSITEEERTTLSNRLEAKVSDRRNAATKIAKDILHSAIKGYDRDNAWAVVPDLSQEKVVEIETLYSNTEALLDRWLLTDRDGDPVLKVMELMSSTMEMEVWMRDREGKKIKQIADLDFNETEAALVNHRADIDAIVNKAIEDNPGVPLTQLPYPNRDKMFARWEVKLQVLRRIKSMIINSALKSGVYGDNTADQALGRGTTAWKMLFEQEYPGLTGL